MTGSTLSGLTLTGPVRAGLSPDAARRVFRAVLDALSRPGQPTTMSRPVYDSGGFDRRVPAVLWPVLALADLSTEVMVLADAEAQPRNWGDLVGVATSAPAAELARPAPIRPAPERPEVARTEVARTEVARPELARARLVAALRPMTPDELRGLARGSAEAPEDGALAALAVPALAGGSTLLRLRGPGVDGARDIAPAGLSDGLLAARAEAVSAFPAGVDLLLVDRGGALLGLPRSTSIEEVR